MAVIWTSHFRSNVFGQGTSLAPAQISDRELRLLRLRAQRLLPGTEAGSVAEAASAAFTIQAQDPPAAALAVRARTAGLTVESARAQAATGSVMRAWLMRNTIHMFSAEDLAWMRPLLAERPRKPAINRLEQLGVGERERTRILKRLSNRVSSGPLPRDDARRLVVDAGVEKDEVNQRSYWLFQLATIEGVIAVAPALDQKQRFIAAPPDRALDRDEGYALLARHFLGAYGPSTPHDLAYWGKVTLSDAKRAFADAGGLQEVTTSSGPMSALPETAGPPATTEPVVLLLPVWENYLLGYEDRSPAVPPPHDRVPGAGRPAATADGLAFGHWRLVRDDDRVTVVIEPFGRLPGGARDGLEAEAGDIGRFLGAEASLLVQRPAR